MNTLMLKIKTIENPHLSDDKIVDECMERLMAKWPQVKGYQFERVDGAINVLMWGDIETDPAES